MTIQILGWKTKNSPSDEKYGLTLISDDGFYEAYIKWDGCCEIIHYSNVPGGDDFDQIHICEMDEFAKMLQTIEKFRKAHFKEQGTLLE